MLSEPRLHQRTAQPYVAIRAQVPMQQLETVIPQSLDEVLAWSGEQGVPATGAPFVRYNLIDMAETLDIEIGVPVAAPIVVEGDARVTPGVLPAGRYAALIYTGPFDGVGLIEANAALLSWGSDQGLVWDSWTTDSGEGFGARLESYLTDPNTESDSARWETEVAIRLADQ